MCVRTKKENCYSIVDLSDSENKKRINDRYAIKALGKDGRVTVIDGVTDDKQFAESVIGFLNENDVYPEHLEQILEEILCGWICLEGSYV